VAYEKLEEKCNRKLEREHKRRLSANLSFTTQNLYEGCTLFFGFFTFLIKN